MSSERDLPERPAAEDDLHAASDDSRPTPERERSANEPLAGELSLTQLSQVIAEKKAAFYGQTSIDGARSFPQQAKALYRNILNFIYDYSASADLTLRSEFCGLLWLIIRMSGHEAISSFGSKHASGSPAPDRWKKQNVARWITGQSAPKKLSERRLLISHALERMRLIERDRLTVPLNVPSTTRHCDLGGCSEVYGIGLARPYLNNARALIDGGDDAQEIESVSELYRQISMALLIATERANLADKAEFCGLLWLFVRLTPSVYIQVVRREQQPDIVNSGELGGVLDQSNRSASAEEFKGSRFDSWKKGLHAPASLEKRKRVLRSAVTAMDLAIQNEDVVPLRCAVKNDCEVDVEGSTIGLGDEPSDQNQQVR